MMKSQIDFPIEIKSGYRYLHIKDIIERTPRVVKARCSRNRLHSFCREDLSKEAWEQLNKGACLSVRISNWKIIDINVIGSG